MRGTFAAEPLWIDLSDLPPGTRASQLSTDRVAGLAAPVRGVPKDTLVGEHLREHRRTMRLARGVVAVLAVLTALAVTAGVVAVGQRNAAVQQAVLAEAHELVADADALAGSQPGLARQYLAQAYRMSDTPLTEGGLLTSLAIPRVVAASRGITNVAYGGNGAWLAAPTTLTLTTSPSLSASASVLLLDPATGSELASISLGGDAISSAVVSPEGNLLAASASDSVGLWQVADPHHPVHLTTITLGGASAALAFSPDGNTLAAAAHAGPPVHGPGPPGPSRVTLFDVAHPARPVPLGNVVVPTPIVSSMAFGADGHTLAVDAGAGTALCEVSRAGALVITGHIPPAASLSSDAIAFAPNGHLLALAAETGSATLWDATDPASPTQVASLAGIADALGITFSPDGRTLATVGPGSVVLWNVSVPGRPTTLARPSTSSGAATLAFSPDGSTLATAGNGNGVDLWNAPQPGSLTEIAASDSTSAHAAITPDSGVLALGDRAGATIWDITKPQVPRLLSTIKPDVTSGLGPSFTDAEGLAIDPSGHLLAIASVTDVSLWSIGDPSHPVLLKTIADAAPIDLVDFSPRGHLLAIADDQHITLWDVTDPPRASPIRTTGKISLPDALAFSPSGQQLAFSTSASSAEGWLWPLTGTAAPARLPALPGCGLACAIYALAFSPDGRTLAAGTLADAYLDPLAGHPRQLPGVAGGFPPWPSAPTGSSSRSGRARTLSSGTSVRSPPRKRRLSWPRRPLS